MPMSRFYSRRLDALDDFIVRLICSTPICLRFSNHADFQSRLQQLQTSLISCVFWFANVYLTSSSKTNQVSNFFQTISSHASQQASLTVNILFNYNQTEVDKGCAVVLSPQESHIRKIRLNLDVACNVSRNTSPGKLYSSFCDAVNSFLSEYERALLDYWDTTGSPRSLYAHHYHIEQHLITIFYPKVSDDDECLLRERIHTTLSLPTTTPLLRRGQALLPIPCFTKWLGPNESLLVCPHEALKVPSTGNGKIHIVQGRYTYKHYLQDGVDDKNWGCAYRSLQTIISWLMWQGEIVASELPSLTDIQSSLVRSGDKPQKFVGSRQWIGSLEISFCLQEMYNIQCRILPVARGANMCNTAAPQLASHFASGGGPVMIGGGQLAHTIIGVQLNEDVLMDRRSARYLILDPHYTGPAGSLKTIIDKGWCGWKDDNFWKPDVFYNLCFAPAIKTGRL